jgi:hypothetical protein
VLNASGVLQALLRVQQLDTVDVAGIQPLYRQLLQQQQPEQQQQQQQQQLLRDYLTAATAKDCAVMVTLQQVQQQQQQQQQREQVPDHTHSTSSSRSDGNAPGSPHTAAAAAIYKDPLSGCFFAWQLSLVDLDLKTVGKVPVHWGLDTAVVAAAEGQPALLQQHVGEGGLWMREACKWLAGGV